MRRIWIVVAGMSGFCAVAMGAATRHIGADPHQAELLDIAARYAMYHALALLALAALTPAAGVPERAGKLRAAAGWCFLFGIAGFSGSLALLGLGAPSWLGWATPLGGTLLLLGWALLAVAGLRAGG
jgi:uncharacterized membrane protein YgdD (TMEM256/DUF423 family)